MNNPKKHSSVLNTDHGLEKNRWELETQTEGLDDLQGERIEEIPHSSKTKKAVSSAKGTASKKRA